MKVTFEGKKIEIRDLPDGKYMAKDETHEHWTPPYVPKEKLEETILNAGYSDPQAIGGKRFCDQHPECFVMR